MTDFVFNVAKGRVAELVQKAIDTTDKIWLIALEASAADATAKDYDTLSAVLGDVGTTEWTAAAYARKDVTATLTRTVNDTADRQETDCDDQTWSSVTGNVTTDLIFAYDPGGASADTSIVPLTQHDWAVTPDGSNITVNIADFFRAV